MIRYDRKLNPTVINDEDRVKGRGKSKKVTMFPGTQEQGLSEYGIKLKLGVLGPYCIEYCSIHMSWTSSRNKNDWQLFSFL